MLDDIKQLKRKRAAELDAFVEKVAANKERREVENRTKLALYRPLIEEFSKESGWTITDSGTNDSSSVSLTGKGRRECRCAITVQTDRVQGWIWERYVLRTHLTASWTVSRYVERFERHRDGIDVSWLRSVLRELYAKVG